MLTVARNALIAYVIQGRLSQEGIESLLDALNGFPGAWLHPFGDQALPVRVLVRRWDLAAASLMLHEVDMPTIPAPAVAGAPPATTRVKRRRMTAVLRVLVGVAVAVMAVAAVSELVVLGPCISHWFCV